MKEKRKKKRIGLIVMAILAAAGGVGTFTFIRTGETGNKTKYEFAAIERGDIENIVSSAGTLEPVGTVNVLAQMNGTVKTVYADYNARVHKNQRLLDLNTEILEIRAQEAQAAVKKALAAYEHSLLEYNNNKKLYEKNLLSGFELHASETGLKSAEATLESAEAKLKRIEIELDQYALILSPIDGIVLDRNVDEGETVVSGTTAATALFTLAEDLTDMKIHAEVDELDISRVYIGQEVRFAVDSFPYEDFTGSVREIRLVPEKVNNIVTYTVIVDAPNPEGKLLPGMTAALEFIIERKENVLLVPNAAFRFEPPREEAAEALQRQMEARIAELPEAQREKFRERLAEAGKMMERENSSGKKDRRSGGFMGGLPFPGPPGGGRNRGGVSGGLAGAAELHGLAGLPGFARKIEGAEPKPLWFLNDQGELSVLIVRTGASDGSNTEIVEPKDVEGKEIILRMKVES